MPIDDNELLGLVSFLYTGNIQVSISDMSKIIMSKENSYCVDDLLLRSIRDKIEGKCNSHGLVRSKSTKIMSRDMGHYVAEFFTGSPVYSVTYTTEILNPTKESLFHVRLKLEIKLD